jgi:hypoxanthine-DNA glycosylase
MSNIYVEIHPFQAFVPPNMTCLIVGSFPGKEQTRGKLDDNAWFYGAPLNQLWRILEKVYDRPLKTKTAKEELFRESGIGMTDIFKSVVRTAGSNLDDNLQVVAYNKEEITKLLETFRPQVLCTSRFVEKEFRKMFPGYPGVDVLPSPSPRYFRITIDQKAALYKQKLPALNP